MSDRQKKVADYIAEILAKQQELRAAQSAEPAERGKWAKLVAGTDFTVRFLDWDHSKWREAYEQRPAPRSNHAWLYAWHGAWDDEYEEEVDEVGEREVPVAVGAIRGWRAFTIKKSSTPQLYSPSYGDYRWFKGEAEAKCAKCSHPGAINCTCGMHVYSNLSYLLQNIGMYHRANAIGLVEMWGRITEHEFGYRSQFARVQQLFVDDRAFLTYDEYDRRGYSYRDEWRTVAQPMSEIPQVEGCIKTTLIKGGNFQRILSDRKRGLPVTDRHHKDVPNWIPVSEIPTEDLGLYYPLDEKGKPVSPAFQRRLRAKQRKQANKPAPLQQRAPGIGLGYGTSGVYTGGSGVAPGGVGGSGGAGGSGGWSGAGTPGAPSANRGTGMVVGGRGFGKTRAMHDRVQYCSACDGNVPHMLSANPYGSDVYVCMLCNQQKAFDAARSITSKLRVYCENDADRDGICGCRKCRG